MTVRGVEVVSIPVTDQDRAKRFYTDVLGLDEIADTTMNEAMRWVQVGRRGGTTLTLVTWFPTMPAGSTKGLVLAVDDIEATAGELSRKGVATANGIERAPWGRFVQVDDPDGNGIVLQESAAS